MTSARATIRLAEVEAEIESLEKRMGLIHGLGDSQSAQGITGTWGENSYWQRRLDHLRHTKRQLEAVIADEPVPTPGVVLADHYPN